MAVDIVMPELLETDSDLSDEDHVEQQISIAKEAADTTADDLESLDLGYLPRKKRKPNVKCEFTLGKSLELDKHDTNEVHAAIRVKSILTQALATSNP